MGKFIKVEGNNNDIPKKYWFLFGIAILLVGFGMGKAMSNIASGDEYIANYAHIIFWAFMGIGILGFIKCLIHVLVNWNCHE